MNHDVTISLMATDAEELAMMLAILRRTDQADTDAVKHARAERDEAMANATGWQRSAETRNADYITACARITTLEANNQELCEHSESLADQVERLTAQLKAATQRLEVVTQERDDCSVLLAKANEKLDGGPNQRITAPVDPQCAASDVNGNRCQFNASHTVNEHQTATGEWFRTTCAAVSTTGACGPDRDGPCGPDCEDTCPHAGGNDENNAYEQERDRKLAERRRLLGGVADLHPDEDPRDASHPDDWFPLGKRDGSDQRT